MINADLEKGALRCSGALDILLTEYTILTNMILNELKNVTNEETAFKIFALLGKIAAEKDSIDSIEVHKKLIKELDNEFKI